VIGSVLAIGALHLPVLLLVAALSFGAAAVALHRRALSRDGLVMPLPSLVCAALAAYTLLQALPLPIRWLEVVAPVAADVWERCLLPFGEHGPRWASLSLDPGASLVEALRWATYAAVFAAAATVSARHGATWGVAMVFGAAMLAALTTLGHGLAGATSVYGLYQPNFRAVAWHVGPLLNPNNLAGYLNLGALCGLGLMLGERPILPRWLLGLGVALIVGIEVTAASRGGVLALPVGVVGLALLTRRDKSRSRTRNLSTGMIIVAVAGGAVLAFLGGTSKTWIELYDTDASKLEVILWVKPLLRDYPLFGVGRGAFESVFPAYHAIPGNAVYTHAENFIVQWVVEWGLPVGVAGLGVFAWAFAPRRLGVYRSALAAGAWCGVAVLLLQNLVDLALEVPAVCIGAAAVLGSLWGDSRRARTSEALRRPRPLAPLKARLLAVGVAAVGAVLAAGAVAFGAHNVESDRRASFEMLDGASKAKPDPALLRISLHHAMLRHPADPYFALVGATAAFRARSESPIPWLERSLERSALNGRAHLLLAQVLAGRGVRKQALLELRLAVEDEPGLLSTTAWLAAHWTRTFDDLLTAVPEGKRGSGVLAHVGLLMRVAEQAGTASPAEIDLGRRCDAEAIRRDPRLTEPRVREAEERIEAILRGTESALCVDHAGCRAQVLDHADAIAEVEPASTIPPTLRANLLLAENKPEEAVKMLEQACEHVTARAVCLQVRVSAAARVKAPAALDAASKELLGASCVTTLQCADTATWLASTRMARGEAGIALGLLARAAREDPANEGRWLTVADVASQAGAHAQAMEALERVAKRHGGADPALKQRIESERSLLLGGLLGR
jgi:tetratricopeptide (TPR) repeat protein